MTQTPNDWDDILDDLLSRVIACPPHHQENILEELCTANPSLAGGLRQRLSLYRQLEALAPSAPAHDPETKLGDYELLRPLGQGGMGIVYLARQSRGDQERLVALKIIRDRGAFSAKARERFLREGSATFKLDHPALCPVYDIGEVDGTPYIAMRYVEGQTLAQHIKEALDKSIQLDLSVSDSNTPTASDATQQHTTGPINSTLAFIETLARGLHTAHEAGLVHRDVKPGNVMVATSGSPVLLDFGLVRDESQDSLTMTGQPIGTPTYMSPEQIDPRGRSIDRTSDIYSLGTTLYEAICLHPPFTGQTREELFRQILSDAAPDIRQHKRQLPRDLQTVLATAMAKEPNQRYATALEFAEDLRRIRACQPIEASRPSMARRLSLWTQRNRLAASVLVLLGLSQAGLVFFVVRAEREAESARLSRAEAMSYFASAREAVQELTRTANSHLEGVPWLEPIRRELIEKALTFYRELLDSRPEDSDLQRLTGIARRQAAALYLRLGDLEIAESWYADAVSELSQLREQAAHSETPTPSTTAELARALAGWGQVAHRRGKLDAATERFERSIAIWRNAPELLVDKTARSAALANALRRLARVHETRGKQTEALELLHQAMAVMPTDEAELAIERAATSLRLGTMHYEARDLEKSTRALTIANRDLRSRLTAFPRERTSLSLLATCLRVQGRTAREQGQLEQAYTFLEEARQRDQVLESSFPDVPIYKLNLAATLENLAIVCRRTKRSKEAGQHQVQTIRLLEPLATKRPNQFETQRSLATAHYNVGNMMRRNGEPGFEDHYRRSLAILAPLLKKGTQDVESLDLASRSSRNLAIGCALRGEHAKAADYFAQGRGWLERLVQLRPNHHRTQVQFASQLYNEGNHLADIDRLEAAETLLARSVAQRRIIVARATRDGRRAAGLLKSLTRLGQVVELRDPTRALATWRDARATFAALPPAMRSKLNANPSAQFDKLCVDRGLGTALLRGGKAAAAEVELKQVHLSMSAFIQNAGSANTIAEWVLTCSHLATACRNLDRSPEAETYLRSASKGADRLSRASLWGLARERVRQHIDSLRRQLESARLPTQAADKLRDMLAK